MLVYVAAVSAAMLLALTAMRDATHGRCVSVAPSGMSWSQIVVALLGTLWSQGMGALGAICFAVLQWRCLLALLPVGSLSRDGPSDCQSGRKASWMG